MPMSSNRAFNLLQTKNYHEKNKKQKLPKDIMALIGLYAQQPPAIETFYELQSFLQEEVFLVKEEKVSGLVFYGLEQYKNSWDYAKFQNATAKDDWSYLYQVSIDSINSTNSAAYIVVNDHLEKILDYLSRSVHPSLSTTPLLIHRAAQTNNLVLLRGMINSCNPEMKQGCYIPLKQVINNRLNVGLRGTNSTERNALDIAAFFGNIEAYRLLINAGLMIYKNRIHPLAFAVLNNHIDFVKTVFDEKLNKYPEAYGVGLKEINRQISLTSGQDLSELTSLRYGLDHSCDTLLHTALDTDLANDKMVALLIEKGACYKGFDDKSIELIVQRHYKESARALIKALGIGELVHNWNIRKQLYDLIILAGGYGEALKLTNTPDNDPLVLALIAGGVNSQALNSMLTARESQALLSDLISKISPVGDRMNEEKSGLIVTAFKALNEKPWFAKICQPDPVEKDLTENQRKIWFQK